MLMNQQYPTEDLYIYEEPTFGSASACIAFVQAEASGIILGASEAYQGRGVDNIYCAEEKALKRLLEDMRDATNDLSI